jgi:hypothetical protein
MPSVAFLSAVILMACQAARSETRTAARAGRLLRAHAVPDGLSEGAIRSLGPRAGRTISAAVSAPAISDHNAAVGGAAATRCRAPSIHDRITRWART